MSAEDLFKGQPVTTWRAEGREFEVYREHELPEEGPKRDQCIEHFNAGMAAELVSDFSTHGCQYPKEDEEPIIGLVFYCPGSNFFKKRCQLGIVQYGVEGNKISKKPFY